MELAGSSETLVPVSDVISQKTVVLKFRYLKATRPLS